MLKESIIDLCETLGIKLPRDWETQINREVQSLISNNKFFGVDITESKKKAIIEAKIMKLKTMFALETLQSGATSAASATSATNTSSNTSITNAMSINNLYSKFGPMIEAFSSSGLGQKALDIHNKYTANGVVSSETILKCIREIVNCDEFENAITKIDITTLTSSFNLLDLISMVNFMKLS